MKIKMKIAMSIALVLLMAIQTIPFSVFASEKSKLSTLDQPAKESNIASIECELLKKEPSLAKLFF